MVPDVEVLSGDVIGQHLGLVPERCHEAVDIAAVLRALAHDVDALVVDRGDLDELFRVKPQAALDLLTATGKHLRETTLLLRHTASRNVNEDE